MRTLWTKIGLGALGVFLVGMLLVTVVEDAKSTMKAALTRVTRPLHVATAELQADIPFVLEGQRLGTVNHMSIRRPAAPGSRSLHVYRSPRFGCGPVAAEGVSAGAGRRR